MTKIRFAKAHGARNDFLFTWAHEAPKERLNEAAVALCDRHSGVGGDGWYLVWPPSGADPARIKLYNADGSEAELSGNGTRCAGAFLLDADLVGEQFAIRTGAGDKQLRLLKRDGLRFLLEMEMGEAKIEDAQVRASLPLRAGPCEATVVWVGNPQCAVFVEHFEWDWEKMGAEIERHERFPNRTNVSFVRVVDRHTVEVRFFERGVGVTNSSGTGSMGAVAAALRRGLAESPVVVQTVAGPLEYRVDEAGVFRMVGPAEIVAGGEWYWG
jgi:diaminopimelate epimerase